MTETWAFVPSDERSEARRPEAPDDFPPAGPDSLATVPRRAAARIADLFLVDLPLLLAVAWLIGLDDLFEDPPLWAVAVNLAVPAVYEIAFLTWRGQTVGKLLWDVRVASLSDGGVPRWDRVLIRVLVALAAAALANLVFYPLFVLPYVVAAWHPLRQGWHDRAADTVVVRTS